MTSPPELPPFEWIDGVAHYRGIRIESRSVRIAGRDFTIEGVADAADLLDQPDFAKRFIEEDCAPYGMELWPAAGMLAEHILNGEPGGGRTAIELGCGLGLVSIAAAVRGWRIVATDNEPASLQFARHNAKINAVDVQAFESLDWRSATSPSDACRSDTGRPDTRQVADGQSDQPAALDSDRRFERIFAADVLYERVNHVRILDCIDRLLLDDGIALIVDPNRSIADEFADLARNRGFSIETESMKTPSETSSETSSSTTEAVSSTSPAPKRREAKGRLWRLRRRLQ